MYIEEEKGGEVESGEEEVVVGGGVVEKVEKLDTGGEVLCSSDSSGKNSVVVLDVRRVMVGVGARALFYPTLLYNVVRNKIQMEFRWWDWIDEVITLFVVRALMYTLVMMSSCCCFPFHVYKYICSEYRDVFIWISVNVQIMSVCFNSCLDKLEYFCL